MFTDQWLLLSKQSLPSESEWRGFTYGDGGIVGYEWVGSEQRQHATGDTPFTVVHSPQLSGPCIPSVYGTT